MRGIRNLPFDRMRGRWSELDIKIGNKKACSTIEKQNRLFDLSVNIQLSFDPPVLAIRIRFGSFASYFWMIGTATANGFAIGSR